ncbi:MAG TPA: putative toxin-antitoxin system toxin component, PIN family [Blastocatellia bacterium]
MASANKPIAVVFDCMVFVQATANRRSAAARVLDLLDTGEIELFLSPAILRELADVIRRSTLRNRLPGITNEAVENLFTRLKKKATLVKRIPKIFTYPRDPKDEPYLNLAIATKASFIVSRDNDLLDLMRWDQAEGREFQKRFRFLRVVTPEAFLTETL